MNNFLWEAVRESGFDANEALELFPNERREALLGIEMPDSLYELLSNTSWEDVAFALICSISTIALSEDSLSILKQVLAPEFFQENR